MNGERDQIMERVSVLDITPTLLLGQNGKDYLKGQADEVQSIKACLYGV